MRCKSMGARLISSLVVFLFAGGACEKGNSPNQPSNASPSTSALHEEAGTSADALPPDSVADESRGSTFTIAYFSHATESGELACYRLDSDNGVAALQFWIEMNAAKFERTRKLAMAPGLGDLRLMVNDDDGVFHNLAVYERVPTEAEMKKSKGQRREFERLFTDEDLLTLRDIFATWGKPVDCSAYPEPG